MSEVDSDVVVVGTLYDGPVYDGNPRDVPLKAHVQIQLDVGRPVVGPVKVTFPGL